VIIDEGKDTFEIIHPDVPIYMLEVFTLVYYYIIHSISFLFYTTGYPPKE
jgi:hypothetical protein